MSGSWDHNQWYAHQPQQYQYTTTTAGSPTYSADYSNPTSRSTAQQNVSSHSHDYDPAAFGSYGTSTPGETDSYYTSPTPVMHLGYSTAHPSSDSSSKTLPIRPRQSNMPGQLSVSGSTSYANYPGMTETQEQYARCYQQQWTQQLSPYQQSYGDWYGNDGSPTYPSSGQGSATSGQASPCPGPGSQDPERNQLSLSTATRSSTSRKKGSFMCPRAKCSSKKGFARLADLQRHEACVHQKETMERNDCPVNRCGRKGLHGFSRRDHLTEHLRAYHHQDIPKRKRRSGARQDE